MLFRKTHLIIEHELEKEPIDVDNLQCLKLLLKQTLLFQSLDARIFLQMNLHVLLGVQSGLHYDSVELSLFYIFNNHIVISIRLTIFL